MRDTYIVQRAVNIVKKYSTKIVPDCDMNKNGAKSSIVLNNTQPKIMQFNIAKYNTVQHSAVERSRVKCSAVQCSAVQSSSVYVSIVCNIADQSNAL